MRHTVLFLGAVLPLPYGPSRRSSAEAAEQRRHGFRPIRNACTGLVGLFALSVLATSAWAAESGKSITVRVVDDHGFAIPTATVRNPLERERHAVNSVTGEWTESVLYLPKGEEMFFAPGDQLQLQVNAPGYASRWVETTISNRRNLIVVELTDMGRAVKCDSRPQSVRCRKQAAEHSPSVLTADVPADFELTPEVLLALGEFRQADPELTAAFSAHLLTLGPDYADQAMFWADHAQDEARTLQGSEYVSVMDGVYEVKAKAANVQWQSAHYEFLLTDFDWSRQHQSETARKRAASIAEEWTEWAEASGSEANTAQMLCLSATDAPGRCE